MVDEVQRQKQKPKKRVDSRIKDALKKSDMVRRLIDQIEIEEEIKNKEIKQEPEKPTYDPRKPPSLKQMKIYEAAKGGMINKYAKGGAVNKNKMITTKGWGASRKT